MSRRDRQNELMGQDGGNVIPGGYAGYGGFSLGGIPSASSQEVEEFKPRVGLETFTPTFMAPYQDLFELPAEGSQPRRLEVRRRGWLERLMLAAKGRESGATEVIEVVDITALAREMVVSDEIVTPNGYGWFPGDPHVPGGTTNTVGPFVIPPESTQAYIPDERYRDIMLPAAGFNPRF